MNVKTESGSYVSLVYAGSKNYQHANEDVLTFTSIGVAHVVGGPIRVIMWVGSGPIHSYEFAPVNLKKYRFYLKFDLYYRSSKL